MNHAADPRLHNTCISLQLIRRGGAEGAAVRTMKINALYAGNISDDDDQTVYSYILDIFGARGSRNAQAGLSKARDLTADRPRW